MQNKELALATIEFVTRCRTDTTAASARRIWRSRCGRFRVVQSGCLFGPRTGRQSIPKVFYAEVHDAFGWSVISKHRGKQHAVKACRRFARNGRKLASGE